MKYTIRRSTDRGYADHGGIKSKHTFSFADYYDPEHMGFRSLRVVNEDCIAPGNGFPMHRHRDMEIFSYVLEGTLEHRDSLGNGRQLQPGQIQLMSAGTGVQHSEYNPSHRDGVHFLQVWIQPVERGTKPRYTEWHPQPGSDAASKVLVISSDGRERSATIGQNADVYRVRLKKGDAVTHELKDGRGAWLQVMRGSIVFGSEALSPGDAASTEDTGAIVMTAIEDAEGLLFDLV
jgi:hypothetical protein